MRKILALMILLTTIVSVASAQEIATYHPRPCGGSNDINNVDLCTWNETLPLGSDYSECKDLNYNTFWPLNTETSATCTFDGSGYEDHTLYISIDNDVIRCTLNGETVLNEYAHENCAPADPRNGKSVKINPTAGTNTLTCYVRDRGVMSYFDACVVGEEPVTHVPEAALAVGLIALLTPGMIYLARRKR
jgi:hypothetical protein